MGKPLEDPKRLRSLRGVEVLEYIGTPEARELLQSLANGAQDACLSREAKASLERLQKRMGNRATDVPIQRRP
jgi:hypothetical protein